MSHTVQIDYQGVAIQCESICEVAEKQFLELDKQLAYLEKTSLSIMSQQSQDLANAINNERNNLNKQLESVLALAKENARTRSGGNCLASAQKLQNAVNELSSKRLFEFEGLLQTLLAESIDKNQRKISERNRNVVTIDENIRELLDGIKDEVLRQFTYVAFLNDNMLVGDRLLQAGQLLMEKTVNKTYEQKYEEECKKIRAELESLKVTPETIDKVLDYRKGTAQERMFAVRQDATTEIIGEKVRQKSLKIIINAIKQRGFVVDKKNIKIKRDTNEVVLVALKASGEKAEFRIFLDGKFIYDFHGYEGQACQKDIGPFMQDLKEIYGIKVTKQTEIWKNPDKISTMKYQAMNTNKNKK